MQAANCFKAPPWSKSLTVTAEGGGGAVSDSDTVVPAQIQKKGVTGVNIDSAYKAKSPVRQSERIRLKMSHSLACQCQLPR